jgi:hypothetical protein
MKETFNCVKKKKQTNSLAYHKWSAPGLGTEHND